jgi:hypothetical protein
LAWIDALFDKNQTTEMSPLRLRLFDLASANPHTGEISVRAGSWPLALHAIDTALDRGAPALAVTSRLLCSSGDEPIATTEVIAFAGREYDAEGRVSYAFLGTADQGAGRLNVDRETTALFDATPSHTGTRGIVEVLVVIAFEPVSP